MTTPLETVVCPVSGVAPSMHSQLEYLLASHPDAPVWQSLGWNEMLGYANMQREGWYIGIHREGEVLAYCLLEVRAVWLGYFGGFVLGGPLLSEQENTTIVPVLCEGIRTLGRRLGLVFVQMEPLVDRDFPGFRAGSYKRFIEPSTVRIDLSGTEEEILSSMHQKGRYNIRLAERAGVIVESVPPTDENLTTFHSLFLETTDRDGFSGAGRGYFAELSRYLAATGEGEMLFARMDERIVAAGIFVHHFRSALYYYGASASDPEVRRAMPTYALQWAAIRRAKSLGCAVYDFLGIEPEEGGDGHLAGVTQFKRRFVPHDTTVWPEARIWIPRPFIYAILRLARTLKKCLRKKA